jgi:hypothetical protein
MDPLSPLPGRAIVRKHGGLVPTDIVDLSAVAMVEVTSEQELYPIDHLFDGRDGPGGSCWMASSNGPQNITLRFNRPLGVLDSVAVESEERSTPHLQTIELAGWSEQTQRPFDGAARQLAYAPYGPTFHRTVWSLGERIVTYIRLRIIPGGPTSFATLTSIVLRSASR